MQIERDNSVLSLPIFRFAHRSGTYGSDYITLLAPVMFVDMQDIAYYRGPITFSKHELLRDVITYSVDFWFGKNRRLLILFTPRTLTLGWSLIKENIDE